MVVATKVRKSAAELETAWALLWLISKTERHVAALTLIGAKRDDMVAGKTLQEWAEPQLAAFRRGEDSSMIPWRRVARILRDRLPAPANVG
ncbi:hypothetical protein V5E97_35400 [Singulisphaera sp. Ch08]|uniref:Uncharacterized protein n=1 Tax=Singulisphaera sp. Ch08 TaxID=3120278 RepID=A0AAU7CE72_9BACT